MATGQVVAGPVIHLGVVGCGEISAAYIRNLLRLQSVDVVAVADLDLGLAEATARQFGLSRACSVDELFADGTVDLVVNLTPPRAHAEVSLAALRAGKHVYSEKPFAITRAEADALSAEAGRQAVRLGAAPDTFLGSSLQTARALVDEGVIGTPLFARAAMLSHGPESWHPSPDFYYQEGGGPLLDMGPYYLTALVSLLGPVRRVSGAMRAGFAERTIGSGARSGEVIAVETPTHITGSLEFTSGVVATVIFSFDVWGDESSLELYGTAGTLRLGDPNRFDGDIVLVRPKGVTEVVEARERQPELERGLGVGDLVDAIQAGYPHRASREMAGHVLDVMLAIPESATEGRHLTVASTCDRPAPLEAERIQRWLAER